MIQRIIGGAVGALVTIAILWWNHVDTSLAATAAIVGAIAAFIWPVIIGWYLVRRGKKRRDDEVQAEVAKQMAQQNQR
jgi:heme A synthase